MNPTLHQLQREIADSLQGLDASQTQLRPPAASPPKWSIQQIVEHLLLTYFSTTSTLESRLLKGTPTRVRPTLHQRVMQVAVFHLGFFPSGREAPPPVVPPATSTPLSGEELAHAAAQQLTRLDRACVQADQLFGSTQSCASHIVLGPLSIHQWRLFQLRHGRLHLKQIAAIRKAYHL